MKDPLTEDGSWSPSVALQLEQLCRRFEAACQSHQKPKIEDYLAISSLLDQSILFAELLGLELEYRRQDGEAPTPEEYDLRFPDLTAVIRDVFLRAKSSPPPSTEDIIREKATLLFSNPAKEVMDPGATQEFHSSRSPAGTESSDISYPSIPGHEILGLLGRGGMGIVFQARQMNLDRIVALKMILAGAQAHQAEQNPLSP